MSRTLVGSSFHGLTSTTMREYVTIRPTGILLRAKKRIVFVPFFTFPGNPSESYPNYFHNPFCQRYLIYFIFIALDIFTVVFTLCLDQSLR